MAQYRLALRSKPEKGLAVAPELLKRLEPNRELVPTGARLVHQLQLTDSKKLALETRSASRSLVVRTITIDSAAQIAVILLNPASETGSPDRPDSESLDFRIVRCERNVFEVALCREQPIERVTMCLGP